MPILFKKPYFNKIKLSQLMISIFSETSYESKCLKAFYFILFERRLI